MKCPHCHKEITDAPSARRVLVVHPNDGMAQQVVELAQETGAVVERAKTGREAEWLLERGDYCLAVVDVAIADPYAFELVPALKKRAGLQVMLLASVYDKTAYKRRPTSLYGADDYLEQHHLPDKLPVVLAKLAEAPPPKELDEAELLRKREALRAAAAEVLHSPASTTFSVDGDEAKKTLQNAAPEQQSQRARELARKLLLDISLYHADAFAAGVKHKDLASRLDKPLADAKRFLAERLPSPMTSKDAAAFIDEAVDEVLRGRRSRGAT